MKYLRDISFFTHQTVIVPSDFGLGDEHMETRYKRYFVMKGQIEMWEVGT